MASKLVQVYYAEGQKEKCFPFSELYYNQTLTVFFENKILHDIVLAVDDKKVDKIGVCSWKLREKLRWYIGKHRELTQEVLETDYDVLSFTKNTRYHQMLAAAEAWHPGFLNVFDKILAKIGVTRPHEVKIPVYQNAHVTKTSIYRDYIIRYLSPAMEVMESDPELKRLCYQDSRYSDLTNQKAEHLQAKIGINYYPLHPFLLERLFSIYCHNERIPITYL